MVPSWRRCGGRLRVAPMGWRLVHVREVIERTTGASARCGLVDASADHIQEIPVWMLDAALCRSMRASDGPVAALPALRTLRSLLSEAMKRTSAVSSLDPQIASPDCHRGDRHAPPALRPRRPDHQLDLFPSSPASTLLPLPGWNDLPEQTRQAVTGLISRLLVAHAGDTALQPRSDGDER